MRTNLSSYQWRILIAVWRKTYGWKKKEDWISVSQLEEMTGIRKSHVSRTKKELIARNILVTNSGNKIGFNKDYQAWRELPNQVTSKKVTNSGSKVTSLGTKKLPDQGNTKEKKETIQKKGTRKNKVTLPGNYSLNEEHIRYAESKGFSKKLIKDEFEGFLIRHRQMGSKFADWNAAWQRWVRNVVEWHPEKIEKVGIQCRHCKRLLGKKEASRGLCPDCGGKL